MSATAREPIEGDDARAGRDDNVIELPPTRSGPHDAVAPGALRPGATVIALCTEQRHPSLCGRVRVRWAQRDGTRHERWVPTLSHLPVRTGDRVLLVQPFNDDEPVVTGTVDGLQRRPEPERGVGATVELKRDEAVQIVGADGQPLIELLESDAGPVVRLRSEDLNVETPGRLRFEASRIELAASAGPVDVRASDDVVVRGEVIHLNP